jgi:hypothetical protein
MIQLLLYARCSSLFPKGIRSCKVRDADGIAIKEVKRKTKLQ